MHKREVKCVGILRLKSQITIEVVACNEVMHVNPPTSHLMLKAFTRTLIVQHFQRLPASLGFDNRVFIKQKA